MYRIKQIPEDFVVKEISSTKIQGAGDYAYYLLKKTNYSTVDALLALSAKLKLPLKNFGFAGNKDKNAVTEQKISIKYVKKFAFEANFSNSFIKLEYLGNGKEPISLGDLEGNEFTITIRNLEDHEIKNIISTDSKKIRIVNFFGVQRFSKNNNLVGMEIIKKDFKKAAELILENNGAVESRIKDYLAKNKNDHVGAIRIIPLKTRKLFVHSFQSFLFNKIIGEYANGGPARIKNIRVPIIGFDFELDSVKDKKLKRIIKEVMDAEKISPRDFIIRQMPELSSQGSVRNLFFNLKDFKILETKEDELNEKRQKIKLKFILQKSCYATVAIEQLLNEKL